MASTGINTCPPSSATPHKMHFGKELKVSIIPRLAEGYLDYALLKALLKSIEEAKRAGGVPAHTQSAVFSANAKSAATSSMAFRPSAKGASKPVHELMSEWVLLMEKEVAKVSSFAKAKLVEAKLATSRLTRRCALGREDGTALALTARELASSVIDLDSFVRINIKAVEKITKKYDKALGTSVKDWIVSRLRSDSVLNTPLDSFLVPLSDVFALSRRLLNPAGEAAGGDWEAPETFARTTLKFWVRPEDVLKLKSFVIEHIPILIYGRSTAVFKEISPLDDHAVLALRDSGPISSVYFDNDAFDCYNDRILRKQSAELFRIRWYGLEWAPKPTQEAFVERKRHEESCFADMSMKERVSLKAKLVPSFLDCTLDTAAMFNRRVADGEAVPCLEAQKRLAAESQASMHGREMKPKIRTRYRRAAYQLASDNTVRLSIDTELQLFNEVVGPRGGWVADEAALAAPGALFEFPYAVLEVKLQDTPPPWVADMLRRGLCTPVWKSSKFMTAVALHHTAGVRDLFPHWFMPDGHIAKVSDYRTAAEEALRVLDLYHVDREDGFAWWARKPGELTDAEAAAAARAAQPGAGGGVASAASASAVGPAVDQPTTLVRSEPVDGFLQPLFPVRLAGQAAAGGGDVAAGLRRAVSVTSLTTTDDDGGTPRPSTFGSVVSLTPRASRAVSAIVRGYRPAAAGSDSGAPSPQPQRRRPLQSTSSSALSEPLLSAGDNNGQDGAGVELLFRAPQVGRAGSLQDPSPSPLQTQKQLPAAARGPLTPGAGAGTGAASAAASDTASRRPGCCGGCFSACGRRVFGSDEKFHIARLVPVRADPKVYFAAERTFLHWTSIAVTIVSLSFIIIQFSHDAAFAIFPVGLVILLYACWQFYTRLRKIHRRDPDGYHDSIGPALLTTVFLGALITNLLLGLKNQTISKGGKFVAGPAPASSAADVVAHYLRSSSSSSSGSSGFTRASASCRLLADAGSLPPAFHPVGLAWASDEAGATLTVASAYALARLLLPPTGQDGGTGAALDITAVPPDGFALTGLAAVRPNPTAIDQTRGGLNSEGWSGEWFVALAAPWEGVALLNASASNDGASNVLAASADLSTHFVAAAPFAERTVATDGAHPDRSTLSVRALALAPSFGPDRSPLLLVAGPRGVILGLRTQLKQRLLVPALAMRLGVDLLLPEGEAGDATADAIAVVGALPGSSSISAPSLLFVMLKARNEVRAYAWPSLAPAGAWQLPRPAAGGAWTSLTLSVDGSRAFLASSAPAEVWAVDVSSAVSESRASVVQSATKPGGTASAAAAPLSTKHFFEC